MEHEARFYKKLKNKIVHCQLCPHYCTISPGNYGDCKARKNIDGKLFAMVYAKPISVAVDPIEKKPLFHFLPGTSAYSVGTTGCNLHCQFCFTPDTIVPTENGPLTLKKIFEEGSDEKSYFGGVVRKINNPSTTTHKGNTKEVVHAFKHHYKGDLIVLKPHYSPEIKCTPNHKFFTTKPPNTNILIKTQAEDLTEGDYLAIPKKHNFFNLKEIETKKILEPYTNIKIKRGNKKITRKLISDVIEMKKRGATSREIGNKFKFHPVYIRYIFAKIRWYGKEGLFFRKNKLIEKEGYLKFSDGRGRGIPTKIKIDEKLATLFGYFVSEGHVVTHKNRPNSHNLVFSFGKHEKKQIVETRRLIKQIFGIEPVIRTRVTTITVECFKAPVVLFFKALCGHGARNKKVPWIINQSSKEVIHAFLQAYVDGDGWIKEDTIISVNTVSKDLALGIYNLFLKLGFLPCFYTWKPAKKKKIENRIVNQSTLYYVKIQAEKFRKKFLNKQYQFNKKSYKSIKFIENGLYYFVPIHKIRTKKYKGHVYNIEVKDDHSYLANFIAVANCQNAYTSQAYPEDMPGTYMPPKEAVNNALRENCKTISYTYNESTIFYEYVYDIAKLARKKKLKNMTVTNGFVNPEPVKELYKYIDAANIDLKGFTEDYYKNICSAKLKPVLETLKLLHKMNVWLEITNLIIPGLNDDMKKIKEMCEWIKKNLGVKYPMHFSRFHPCYKMMDRPRTPYETLKKAYDVAKKVGLKYVYVGNVPEEEYNHTYCHKCNETIIRRSSFFQIEENKLKNGKCFKCKTKIDGVWK